jgi:phosphate:Na+ symporter
VIGTVLGGLGLFLLGMVLLTDGLKALAGESLRGFLARFTGGRFSSMASGAAITALVQSSSATTLTTIGFVSAGLLSFEQAVGVIVGANLGTTSTGWLVSLLGLKLSVGKLALPVVGVGALLKLLTRERGAALGLAISGFGLVFIGIETLQGGMSELAGHFQPEDMPSAALPGRLLLVLLGVLMTVVMQSSSAAVATTLTALHAGTLGFDQAAALVIGQNVGTTVTAGLGAIGATTAAKRTALAHVSFNVSAGLLAFLALRPAVAGTEALCGALGVSSPALLLAAFHTLFNLAGVLLIVPLVQPFADLIRRTVPERGPQLTRRLDPSVLSLGAVALEAARRTLREASGEAVGAVQAVLAAVPQAAQTQARLERVELALGETSTFLGALSARGGGGGGGAAHRQHVAILHGLDHLLRFCAAGRERTRYAAVREHPEVARVLEPLRDALELAGEEVRQERELPVGRLGGVSRAIAETRRERRPHLIAAAAGGELTPNEGDQILEAVRWLDRLGFHLWRAAHHLAGAEQVETQSETAPDPDEPS